MNKGWKNCRCIKSSLACVNCMNLGLHNEHCQPPTKSEECVVCEDAPKGWEHHHCPDMKCAENRHYQKQEEKPIGQDLRSDPIELKAYITNILLDVRGDNEYPTNDVIKANASLLFTYFQNYLSSQQSSYRRKVKELKKDGKQLEWGIIRTQRMRLKTVKSGSIEMAYEDGFNACLDSVLELLEEGKSR